MSDNNIEKNTDIEKMAAPAREVLGAVVGLAKTCGNNPYTDDTIRLICDTLIKLGDVCGVDGQTTERAASEKINLGDNGGELDAHKIVEQLHAEKYKISPGCAVCQARCGNTDDYDVTLILDEESQKLKIKEELIYNAFELAKAAHENNALYSDNAYRLVLLGVLTVLSYDMSIKGLENALEQAKNWI